MAQFGSRSSIIAHRGASDTAPENTLAAFSLAWSQGASAIELDVRLTKDRRIVAMHDATTGRTCDRDLPVADTDYEELSRLDAGIRKGRRWAGEKIPLLEEVLSQVPHYGRIFIELKCGNGMLRELRRVLAQSSLANRQICLIGFDFDLMARTKSRFPELEVCWISRPRKNSRGLSPTPDELIAKAASAHLDGLDLHKSHSFDEDFVKRVHAAGLTLYVWTVDNAAMAKRLHELGMDGITTNKPGKTGRAIHRTGWFSRNPFIRQQAATAPWMPGGAANPLFVGPGRRAEGSIIRAFVSLLHVQIKNHLVNRTPQWNRPARDRPS